MWVADGYSVIEKTTGERLLGCKTRNECEKTIKNFGIRNAMITKRWRWVAVPKKREVVEDVQVEPPKKYNTLYVALKNIGGEEKVFNTKQEVADFFGVTVRRIEGWILERKFSSRGKTKGWYMYTKTVEVEDDTRQNKHAVALCGATRA